MRGFLSSQTGGEIRDNLLKQKAKDLRDDETKYLVDYYDSLFYRF